MECYQCPQFSGYSKCYEGGDDYGEVMTCPPGVYACYNNWSGKYPYFRSDSYNVYASKLHTL